MQTLAVLADYLVWNLFRLVSFYYIYNHHLQTLPSTITMVGQNTASIMHKKA